MTQGTAGQRAPRRAFRRLAGLTVTLAVMFPVVPVGAAPLKPQPCEFLAVSPVFASDGIAFCAGTVTEGFTPVGLAVFVSDTKGRSWRQADAVGLPFKPGDRMSGLDVSPRYASDRTVFVSVLGAGVFVSADAGETFLPLLPGGVPKLVPFTGGVSTAAQRTMVLANQWNGGKPALVDPVARSIQPVMGAPDPASGFLVSPAWTQDHVAYALTDTGALGKSKVTIYACSVVFDCSSRLTTFPAGFTYLRGWLAADFAKSKTIFVEVRPELGGAVAPRLYVSRNGGTTFTLMSSAQTLVSSHLYKGSGGGEPAVALATGPAGSDRVWMRVYGSARATAPTTALYRSDDNGRTWVRVAYGRINQSGPRGTMLDLRVPTAAQPPVLLAATGDNRVFLNGLTSGGWGVGCSADAGRTWATFCR